MTKIQALEILFANLPSRSNACLEAFEIEGGIVFDAGMTQVVTYWHEHPSTFGVVLLAFKRWLDSEAHLAVALERDENYTFEKAREDIMNWVTQD